MTLPPVIFLFRRDLRLADNRALSRAVAEKRPLIPLYVLDETDPYPIRGARRWWLHHSLAQLGADLAAKGSPLVLRRDNTADAVRSIAEATGADTVYWTRRDLPAESAVDDHAAADLQRAGLAVHDIFGGLLRAPSDLRTPSTGEPYRVFTPFFKRLHALGPDGEPADAPRRLTPPAAPAKSLRLEDLALLPTRPNWAAEFGEWWRPGEAGAEAALDSLIADRLDRYADRRDFPGEDSTSRLSPHLAFGELSPARLWRRVAAADAPGRDKFLSELGWREFCHHLLNAFPAMGEGPLQPKFRNFPYRDDEAAFRLWSQGRTGYPIVDAGMRQLWRTGWMHNRVRMIVASFLTKHLLIDWRRGEEWFADTLVDYDPASNIASWQWVAGCGADAAPYFRIFNPTLQSAKFDPDGAYVRRFVPELSPLAADAVHEPSAAARRETGYPFPMVDHAEARRRALEALEAAA
ncbi:MAG: deoxyribodipyrimidine photo-lyase [Parvularculaceae bacterium]|nr:deoxyribodipyrimidine photo-lyase [Parvularculaceae bacterium]